MDGAADQANGSAAGHNGVKSIIAALKTEVFTGCGWGFIPDHPIEMRRNMCSLLSSGRLKKEVEELVSYTADAVESIIAEGVEKAMTKFNRRARGLQHRGRMRIYEELFIVQTGCHRKKRSIRSSNS